jgi:ssDNA-binding Zn-finger/Zn-ribbon topoisomerase 1
MSNIQEGFDERGMAKSEAEILKPKRECVECHRTTTTIDNRHHTGRWYKYKDGYICHNCYCKIIWSQKRKEKRIAKKAGRPAGFIINKEVVTES